MIRLIKPDKKKAESIIARAEKDVDFTLKIAVSESSASTIIRNIYESFRMLGDALLIAKGIRSQDHSSQLKELMKLKVTASKPVGVLENLKRVRHSINYHGYSPRITDVEDAINIAKSLFKPLLKVAKEEISK